MMSEMLKKVFVLMFVCLALVAPMTVSAIGNEPAGVVKTSLSVESVIVKKELLAQVAGDNVSKGKNAAPQSQAVDKSNSILPNGWLLTLALLGFVWLSNRSGV